MADDWSNIVLRFAIYIDLMVLFGVPLFAVSVLGPGDRNSWIPRRYAALAAVASVLGLALSVLGLLAMAKQMAGSSDYSSITGHVVQMILTRTAAGITWVLRVLALAVCVLVALALRGRYAARFVVLSAFGAVALGTLAWTGHAAMEDGARGYLHLISDVLHLVAAGAWVGALVAFVVLSLGLDHPAGTSVEALSRTAAGFARIGTAIVGTLVVTGTINYLLIVGPSIRDLVSTVYGRLLLAKLVVFTGMLGLAAANRYRLSPRLESAMAGGQHLQAARMLRRSLWTEASLATVVLALVAWLGVLAPDA